MKNTILCAAFAAITVVHLQAADDFTVQMTRNMHDDVALSHDIYTTSESAGLWNSSHDWLQKPAVGIRFNYQFADRWAIEDDTYNPMLSLKAETFGGVNVGLVYSHTVLRADSAYSFPSGRRTVFTADLDSAGLYVAKQFDCGFNVGLSYTYSDRYSYVLTRAVPEDDASALAAAVGFARSFGEKKLGRNVFVDTSVNYLYQANEEIWDFIWMAKVGTSLCDRFAIYGIFNLYDELDYDSSRRLIPAFSGYRPFGDGTWGETGGGIQAQLGAGFTLTADVTMPVLDEGTTPKELYLVRADLTWRF